MSRIQALVKFFRRGIPPVFPGNALMPFLRDSRASILVEFAIIAPILIMMLLGGVELGRFILLDQKLDRTAMTVADLIARTQKVTALELDAIFAAADASMDPFAFGQSGTIIATSVLETGGTPKVMWQRAGGGTLPATSQVGTPGGTATLSDNLLVDANNAVIVGEAFYSYSPWFIELISARTLHRQAVLRPRQTGIVTCPDC